MSGNDGAAGPGHLSCTQVMVSMLWTLYCLSRNAHVQDAVYRHTAAVLADSSGHVTADSLQRLHYIRASVKETLRSRSHLCVLMLLPTTLVVHIEKSVRVCRLCRCLCADNNF